MKGSNKMDETLKIIMDSGKDYIFKGNYEKLIEIICNNAEKSERNESKGGEISGGRSVFRSLRVSFHCFIIIIVSY